MGYFANGTEGEMYQERYCEQCVHDRNHDCPILALHLMHNYQDGWKNTLDLFIPRDNEGFNLECKMFLEYSA